MKLWVRTPHAVPDGMWGSWKFCKQYKFMNAQRTKLIQNQTSKKPNALVSKGVHAALRGFPEACFWSRHTLPYACCSDRCIKWHCLRHPGSHLGFPDCKWQFSLNTQFAVRTEEQCFSYRGQRVFRCHRFSACPDPISTSVCWTMSRYLFNSCCGVTDFSSMNSSLGF